MALILKINAQFICQIMYKQLNVNSNSLENNSISIKREKIKSTLTSQNDVLLV